MRHSFVFQHTDESVGVVTGILCPVHCSGRLTAQHFEVWKECVVTPPHIGTCTDIHEMEGQL